MSECSWRESKGTLSQLQWLGFVARLCVHCGERSVSLHLADRSYPAYLLRWAYIRRQRGHWCICNRARASVVGRRFFPGRWSYVANERASIWRVAPTRDVVADVTQKDARGLHRGACVRACLPACVRHVRYVRACVGKNTRRRTYHDGIVRITERPTDRPTRSSGAATLYYPGVHFAQGRFLRVLWRPNAFRALYLMLLHYDPRCGIDVRRWFIRKWQSDKSMRQLDI